MENIRRRPHKRNRYAAPIGGVFIVLCIIGLIDIIGFCVTITQNILDHAGTKQSYATRLLPIVMFDPPPFTDPVNLPSTDLLTYSLWSAILSTERDELVYDDTLGVVVSANQVDMQAFTLFGPDVQIVHGTIGAYQTYYYVQETRSYHVPINAISGVSTPRVESITKSGDTVELRVGYVPPTNILNIDLDNTGQYDSEPVKYMDYILKEGATDMYVYAIREPAGGSVPDYYMPSIEDMYGDGSGNTMEGLLPPSTSTNAPQLYVPDVSAPPVIAPEPTPDVAPEVPGRPLDAEDEPLDSDEVEVDPEDADVDEEADAEEDTETDEDEEAEAEADEEAEADADDSEEDDS